MSGTFGGGDNLGRARGSIEIDTSQLNRVQATARSVGQDVQRNLGGIGAGAARAGVSVSALAGAFGIGFGAAGLAQMGRYALGADEVATAFERQGIAARNLAGGQAELNELLAVYDKTMGGAVDRATALADVTRLQAVGFADSAAELEKFTRAARGVSIATGQRQDYIISQLTLAIANQSTMRLDQLGLSVAEVEARIKSLRDADKSLSKEMAYQNAILGLAEEKYGALVDSAEAQATGAEKSGAAFKDLRLEVGLLIDEPLGEFLQNVARDVNSLSDALEDLGEIKPPAWLMRFLELTSGLRGGGLEAGHAAIMRQLGLGPQGPEDMTGAGPTGLERNRQMSRSPRLGGVSVPVGFTDAQTGIMEDYYTQVRDLERQSANDRLEATRQYEQQRSDAIRQYETSIARDAEDFARGRQRQAAELDKQIADVREEAGRREAEQIEEHAERLAEVREDAAKRVAELEEDYARQREQAQEDHEARLQDAASNLDAKAIYEEQRRFARESKQAQEAHKDQLKDTQDALEERTRDEEDAYEERLQEAREADERRIEDMRDALAEQQRLEDEDRRIRLERQAQDHQAQLEQMDVEQQARLAQIAQQEAEERKALDDEFLKLLNEEGVRNEAWWEQQQRLKEAALKLFDDWWKEIGERFQTTEQLAGRGSTRGTTDNPALPTPFAEGGWVTRGGLALLHAGEFVMPAPAARGSNASGGGPLTLNASIVINEASRPGQTGEEVRAALISLMKEAAA